MKQILVINTGSSSVKYRLFAMPEEKAVVSGVVESIGEADRRAVSRFSGRNGDEARLEMVCADHAQAVAHIFELLADPEKGVPGGLSGIDAVGHRVVHGGERFSAPVAVNEDVLASLGEIVELAPLHMPLNIAGIRACIGNLPGVKQVACFDTAFFRNMPQSNFLYPVPFEWYEQYSVRRYGFHGISYEYLTDEAARQTGRPADRLKIIAAHLGNGCSVMACDKGLVRDTSMGFTPLEGLMMGTRSGSFDPAILPYMTAKTGISADGLLEILNTQSGLAGISGVGRDMREIIDAMENGSQRAGLAFDMFVHILKKYIGAYFFVMGGADCVVLSGGIGENCPEVRAAVFEGLSFAGLFVDPEKNRETTGGRAGKIHADGAGVSILVIPANEERMIARSVFVASDDVDLVR